VRYERDERAALQPLAPQPYRSLVLPQPGAARGNDATPAGGGTPPAHGLQPARGDDAMIPASPRRATPSAPCSPTSRCPAPSRPSTPSCTTSTAATSPRPRRWPAADGADHPAQQPPLQAAMRASRLPAIRPSPASTSPSSRRSSASRSRACTSSASSSAPRTSRCSGRRASARPTWPSASHYAAQRGRRVYYGTLVDLIARWKMPRRRPAGAPPGGADHPRCWWSTRSATCRFTHQGAVLFFHS